MAKLVYRIVCGDGNHTAQFDEQLRLISAADQEQALDKAQLTGDINQYSFMNDKNQRVEWKFINVSELYRLPELSDGSEMYSRVEESEHAAHFIETVNRKADQLRSSVYNKVSELT